MAIDKRSGALHIGLFGFGVVGTAVYTILERNREQLARSSGGGPLLVRRAVVRDLAKYRPVAVPAGLLSDDPGAILDDPGIDLVVEAMGGVEPARTYVLTALGRGKSVITANKELVAEHSQELLAAAAAAGADLFFEASVGGGIPILRPLQESLAGGGRVHRVMGIVNGTTNYILTRMGQAGTAFRDALAEAQAAGYAEPDPTADIEGHDPARKIAILASLAFHTHVKSGQIPAEGITRIAPADLAYGKERGWTLKLLAMAERQGEGIGAWVHPAFLPDAHPLAGVSDAFNAIYVHGEEVGETMFYGRGAGGLPTASAVIGDILEAARHKRLGVSISAPWARAALPVAPAGQTVAPYYLRVRGDLTAAETAAAPRPAGRTAAAVAAPAAVAALTAAGVAVTRYKRLDGGAVAAETGPIAGAALAAAAARAGVQVENAIRIVSC